MESPLFLDEHWNDANGNPAGGVSQGCGFTISWQNGPLKDPPRDPNGAFLETVINACMKRLEFYQASKFACKENQEAHHHLGEAKRWLNDRTKEREARGVQGTHAV